MDQERESRGSLHECANRGAVEANNQVAFPVPWNGSVLDLSWTFADHDLRTDKLLAAIPAAGSRYA